MFQFYLIKKFVFLSEIESYFKENILFNLKSFSILYPVLSSSNFVKIEHSLFIRTIIYNGSNEQIVISTEQA